MTIKIFFLSYALFIFWRICLKCPKSEGDNDDARMEEENIWDILILAWQLSSPVRPPRPRIAARQDIWPKTLMFFSVLWVCGAGAGGSFLKPSITSYNWWLADCGGWTNQRPRPGGVDQWEAALGRVCVGESSEHFIMSQQISRLHSAPPTTNTGIPTHRRVLILTHLL